MWGVETHTKIAAEVFYLLRLYVVRVCSDSNPPKSDKLTAITTG